MIPVILAPKSGDFEEQGSKNPMADNSSEEGKAQNRRVELVKK